MNSDRKLYALFCITYEISTFRSNCWCCASELLTMLTTINKKLSYRRDAEISRDAQNGHWGLLKAINCCANRRCV